MLKKLLKYDLKSVFSIWWILAVTLIGVAFVFSLALGFLSDADGILVIVPIFSGLAYYFGIVVFSIGSMLLVYVRFYKNFFSDEGYLTFTLPAKRSELFLSKFLTGFITQLATISVIFISLFEIICFLPVSFKEDILPVFKEIFVDPNLSSVAGWIIAIAVVVFLIALVSAAMNLLFVYFCITVGAIIAKKHKVLAAIGIYYGANAVLSIAQTIFTFVLNHGFAAVLSFEIDSYISIFLLLSLVFVIFSAVTAVMYYLDLRFIKRKLNLP